MPEVTPLDSGDDGVSVWTVVAIVVGAVVLVSVPLWFVIQSLIDSDVLSGESSSPEATSANPVDTTPAGEDSAVEEGSNDQDFTAVDSAANRSVLEDVLARGLLRCGVGGSHPGFSVVDATGGTGFDVDFCRAVAAAVLGNADAVEFIPVSARERFAVVRSGVVDVLFRTTTPTLSRDAVMGEGLDFGSPIFYDGQQFMGRSDQFDQNSGADDVAGARLCVRPNTPAETEAVKWAATQGSTLTLVPFDSASLREEVERLTGNECDLLTGEGSSLASARSVAIQDGAADEGELTIFPAVPITREPLAPGYRQGDAVWADIVTWVRHATVIADQKDVSSTNIDTVDWDSELRRLFGVEGGLVTALGLEGDALYRVVKQVGNYTEIYERNLAPLGLNRKGTMNANHTDGGLIYAPPAR